VLQGSPLRSLLAEQQVQPTGERGDYQSMEMLNKLVSLWGESSDEDRQQLARMIFEEIFYKLDQQRIGISRSSHGLSGASTCASRCG